MRSETLGVRVPQPEIRVSRVPQSAVLKCILVAMLFTAAWLGYDLAKAKIELQHSNETIATWRHTCESIRDYEVAKHTR